MSPNFRSTLGVSQLVHFGARAAKVDDTLVDLLRQRERAVPTEALFHSGDSVVITDGPFAGIEAIYQMADAEPRFHPAGNPRQTRIHAH